MYVFDRSGGQGRGETHHVCWSLKLCRAKARRLLTPHCNKPHWSDLTQHHTRGTKSCPHLPSSGNISKYAIRSISQSINTKPAMTRGHSRPCSTRPLRAGQASRNPMPANYMDTPGTGQPGHIKQCSTEFKPDATACTPRALSKMEPPSCAVIYLMYIQNGATSSCYKNVRGTG